MVAPYENINRIKKSGTGIDYQKNVIWFYRQLFADTKIKSSVVYACRQHAYIKVREYVSVYV